MFKIGQMVLCIKTGKHGYTIKGEKYKIEKVSACKCGTVLQLKGVYLEPGFKGIKCGKCGIILEDGVRYNSAKRFVPIDEVRTFADEVEENINELVKKEELMFETFV